MRRILILEAHGLKIGIPGVHATSQLTIIPTHSNRIPSSSASKSHLLPYFSLFVRGNGSYAKSVEIWEYMKMVAEKYGSYKYIKLEHRVVGALWHEDTAKCKLQIQKEENSEDLLEDEVDVFINAGGILKYFPC